MRFEYQKISGKIFFKNVLGILVDDSKRLFIFDREMCDLFIELFLDFWIFTNCEFWKMCEIV